MTKRIFKLMMLMGVLAMSFTFIACGGDDDDTLQITEKNVVGKWILEKAVIDGKEKLPEFFCPKKKDYRELKEDGTLLDVEYNENCKESAESKYYEENRSWKLEDGKFYETFRIEELSTGEVMETSNGVFSIQKITANTMVLLFLEGYTNGKKDEVIDENKDGKADDVLLYFKRLE